MVRAVVQEMLEAEMTDALGAGKGERTSARLGYRSGHYTRTLVTRVGKLELRVPQDRDGRFSTELFERYQRSEQALAATLAEMYLQGVSTRKVKAITEALCGHAFSASAVSAINKRLDDSLDAFARRPLAEPFPYLIVDARYERVDPVFARLAFPRGDRYSLPGRDPAHSTLRSGLACRADNCTSAVGRSRSAEKGRKAGVDRTAETGGMADVQA